MKTYSVQTYVDERLGWREVPFTKQGSKTYCEGWVDCMDSHYPSRPCRIVCVDSAHPSVETVVRETRGRGEVHTN